MTHIVKVVNRLFDVQFGYTPLHRAAAQGHLEVIEVLLSHGCPVDCQDDVSKLYALNTSSQSDYSRMPNTVIVFITTQ